MNLFQSPQHAAYQQITQMQGRDLYLLYCSVEVRKSSKCDFSPPGNKLLLFPLSVSAYNHNLLHYLPMQSNRKHLSLDPIEQKSFLP